jgi:hypothetical protein
MEHDGSYSIVLWFSLTVTASIFSALCGRLMIDACTVERNFIRQTLRFDRGLITCQQIGLGK